MSTEYVSEDDIEAHRVALQRVVEDERKEQEEICDKKTRAIPNHLEKYGFGRGGLNSFRMANKRLKQVIESCTCEMW